MMLADQPALIFVMTILASFRVAHMVTQESGPFHAFERLRGYVQQRFGIEHWVFDGVTCVLCASFWASWFFAAALWLPSPVREVALFALFALGTAGGVLVIQKILVAQGKK